MIILAAKEAGPQDNISYYKTYLQNKRTFSTPRGQQVTSAMKHVRETTIDNHVWVDALHLSSESDLYFTRYVGTVKNHLAIFMTLSAHKAHYTKYSADFLRAIQSIKVIDSKNPGPKLGNFNPSQSPGKIGGDIGNIVSIDDELGDDIVDEPNSKKDLMTKGFGILLLISAIGLYLYAKKK